MDLGTLLVEAETETVTVVFSCCFEFFRLEGNMSLLKLQTVVFLRRKFYETDAASKFVVVNLNESGFGIFFMMSCSLVLWSFGRLRLSKGGICSQKGRGKRNWK